MSCYYRLSELLILALSSNDEDNILLEHPNSIGAKYIIEKRNKNNSTSTSIDIITKIIIENIEENINFLPKNIENSIVIHFTLGDIINENKEEERLQKLKEIDYIKSLISNDTNQKYIIGNNFFDETNSINELEAEYFNSNNIDIDIFCAIKSKLFIEGKSFLSNLIVEIRKKLNLANIERN